MKADAPLWKPDPDRVQNSYMQRFISTVNETYRLDISDYADLHDWSVNNSADFWKTVWKFAEVKSSRTFQTVLENGNTIRDAKWFSGCRFNFAENLLEGRNNSDGSAPAIVFHGEDVVRKTLSYDDLRAHVAATTVSLKSIGVKPGDRVAGFLPNIPEAIVAMLATTSIGAIWSSCSPDFGFNGVMDRFSQIKPKVLFAADGYYFKSKSIDTLSTTKKLSESIESLSAVIIIPYVSIKPNIEQIKHAQHYQDILAEFTTSTLEFEQLPFNHPLFIMFSSGTTGTPKCIVHGAGGTLLQHLKELMLHTDVKAQDRLFYFTTCGWMMWNWLVSGLATGASLILYDGSPFHPGPSVLMDLIDGEKITIFGTSAKYISALEKAGVKPKQTHHLSSLKTILSTGSPLSPESFHYIYRDIKNDVQLSSISGGTDIISCFALGNPILPVYRGELQCKGLAMDVDVFNDRAESVTNQKGELVCKSAFPSMPLYFWNDTDGSKYQAAYFNQFPKVWAHGDYAELTNHGGLIIHGRSDAVLNPGGVRIGTAEIYRQVEKIPEVVESIAIGQNWRDDVRVILFVKLRDNKVLDSKLVDTIKQNIRNNTTPRHVPAKILQVSEIPRTISGKIVELAVRNVIHGEVINNIDVLANPEALNNFKNLKELETD